jgi:glycosyltransferase involved in cell wall biosynthesis
VLLVAPSAPPYGGMQLQADLLKKLLDAEQGFFVTALASNPAFPRYLRFLEILRGVRPFARAVVFCFRFWRELEQIDVVHVMAASWLYFFLVVYPAVCLSRLRGKPVIVNYRGGEAGSFLSIWGRLARPAFRMADLVTAPSRFLKQILESHARVPVSVVPNVVNLSAFRYRQRTDLKPTILVTRHLEKIYDLESVLRAFRRIQERRPDACLWIAGTGGQEGYLRSLVSAWSLRNVRFLGQVSHEELPAVYDQCDIFLNASRVDNFPGALLEASASGLVVVTTNAGGIPYIYEQGKNALLVERGDYEGLALEVERVLEEPTLAFNLTTAALALVRQFEWKNVGESLRESYAFARTCRASSIRFQKSYI